MGFDNSAYNYFISSDHKSGADLDIIKEYFADMTFNKILDVASAAGHCGKSFRSEEYFFSDLSFNMLRQVKGNIENSNCVRNFAENLPFKDKSFDAVSCRIALHHFVNPDSFFRETRRILKEKGFLIFIDSVVDVDDAYLNAIEFIRDNTHIRSYTLGEIVEMTESLFRIEYLQNIYKKHHFKEWGMRLNPTDEEFKNIEKEFLNLPEDIRKELHLKVKDKEIVSYTDKKYVVIMRKL